MIHSFATWLGEHTEIIIILGGFITAPITFFFLDAEKHPERYKHK